MRAFFYNRVTGLYKAVAMSICLLGVFGVSFCPGGETSLSAVSDDFDAAVFAELADDFRRHCVRVYVLGKSHDGKVPEVGEFSGDINNERSTLMGGYWWDDRHVIIEDPVLQDQFIRSVEIGLPFSDARYPARVAGRMVKLPAILLEILPGESGLLPRAFPLEFTDAMEETEPFVFSYGWENGEWRIDAGNFIGGVSVTDSGTAMIAFGANGVVMSKDGSPLGLAFGEAAAIGGEFDILPGESIHSTPCLSRGDSDAFNRELRRKLADAVLQTRIVLRVKIDDDDADDLWMSVDDGSGTGISEVRATGLVVGRRHLFIPLALGPEAIARIEDITVIQQDGSVIPCGFIGAFREYRAILVEADRDLDFEVLPSGFELLNPLVVPSEAFEVETAGTPFIHEYFYRWRVDHVLGRRREAVDYDRWMGTFRGYRGDAVVLTKTNEEDGALAFDTSGRLVALALEPRVMREHDADGGARLASAGFRPIDFIYGKFHGADVFDPTLLPVEEERGRRLVDLGVEYQKLDGNTSRLFHAARETRGGDIGMLITYVYPGTIADLLDLRVHDILLRISLDGEREPVELKADDYGSSARFDFDDMSSETIQQIMGYMPPPWPTRENNLARLLTRSGVGRNAEIEYLREGEVLRAEFVTEYGAPDYRNAPKEKCPGLGITTKPITYEVARYFGRTENSGVIASKVEEGGRGAVAGLHPYLFITRVDGRPIANMDDFRSGVFSFEEGTAPAVELMVEAFGKTRLVKIEQRN